VARGHDPKCPIGNRVGRPWWRGHGESRHDAAAGTERAGETRVRRSWGSAHGLVERETPDRRDQSADSERKVRRPGSSAPPGSLRPMTAYGRRTSLRSIPLGVPPCESVPLHRTLHVVAPLRTTNHQEVAVLMMRTLIKRCRNQGHIGLQLGCPVQPLEKWPPGTGPTSVTPAGRRRLPSSGDTVGGSIRAGQTQCRGVQLSEEGADVGPRGHCPEDAQLTH
jgi:hypothetical protein